VSSLLTTTATAYIDRSAAQRPFFHAAKREARDESPAPAWFL